MDQEAADVVDLEDASHVVEVQEDALEAVVGQEDVSLVEAQEDAYPVEDPVDAAEVRAYAVLQAFAALAQVDVAVEAPELAADSTAVAVVWELVLEDPDMEAQDSEAQDMEALVMEDQLELVVDVADSNKISNILSVLCL